jgi:hypothetical protein
MLASRRGIKFNEPHSSEFFAGSTVELAPPEQPQGLLTGQEKGHARRRGLSVQFTYFTVTGITELMPPVPVTVTV